MRSAVAAVGVLAVFAALLAPSVRAQMPMSVDATGVMRFEDGSEVALWGVNYYVPFTCDYRGIAALKRDHKTEIRRDLAHFKRLGLTSIRIHCFDRQISDAEGGLVDNDHLDLLDYLIAEAAKAGIYTMLTPIAWWGDSYAPEKGGFSCRFPMREMTSRSEAWKIQARYLGEFAAHVNRYTGKRYADDPAVSCFELINEPLYPANHPDDKVVAYVNALAAGLRSSGTRKPVFYNSWQSRNAACSRANIDGVTGSHYPTELVAGRTLDEPQLGRIKSSSLNPDSPKDRLVNRARVIYEFDAADTPGTYMYPAFARLFRHEGVQIANMFQYDPLAVAPVNNGWQTHFLNLVYAPGKALSFAIAGEAFRAWPRLCDFTPDEHEMRHPPFRVNADEDVSEFITETAALYSNDTAAKIPAPGRLERVWGVGGSAVARSTGNGAYFLDRVEGGFWSLQLYPNVATLRDVHSGGKGIKKAVSIDRIALTLALPDLGADYTVWCNGVRRGKARDGRFRLDPGEYQLTRGESLPTDWRARLAKKKLAAFVAPLGDGFWQPPEACDTPFDYSFFEIDKCVRAWHPGGWQDTAKDDRGRRSFRFWAHGGFTEANPCVSMSVNSPMAEFRRRFPSFAFDDANDALVFHIRARIKETTKVEIVLVGTDGEPWGTNVEISPEWRDVRVPLASLRFFSHFVGGRGPAPGARPSLSNLMRISFCFGTWLFPDTSRLEHGIELSGITIASRPRNDGKTE